MHLRNKRNHYPNRFKPVKTTICPIKRKEYKNTEKELPYSDSSFFARFIFDFFDCFPPPKNLLFLAFPVGESGLTE